LFVGLHAMLALQTATPELEIDQGEGEQFMKAAQNVMRHYGVTATQKSLDMVALFGVAVGMYGPRIAAIRFRKAAEREAKKHSRDNVVRFSQPVGMPPAGTDFTNYGGGFRDPNLDN